MSKSVFREEYADESGSGKLSRKARDSPFMVFGLAGLAAVVGMGAYKYSRRGQMSTSVFLMQLRVAAQGTVVAALSVGLAYTMTQKYILHNPDYQLPSHDHSTTHDATAHASHDASGSIVTPSSSEHPTKH